MKIVLLKLAFLRFAPTNTARSNRTSLRSASCASTSSDSACTKTQQLSQYMYSTGHWFHLKIGICRHSFDEVGPLELGALEVCIACICRSEVGPPEILQQCSTTGCTVLLLLTKRNTYSVQCDNKTTCPEKSFPLSSASPNCAAVPTPNSPPAAASNLFRSARAG